MEPVRSRSSTYQYFIGLFTRHDKERLDGLNESHFAGMTDEERHKAFSYLLNLVESGGTEESVNGLFLADPVRAIEPVERLLSVGKLREEARIPAAWNLYRIKPNAELHSVFIEAMSGADHRLRSSAVYYVPPLYSDDLNNALRRMIRTETVQLARIHAVDKLLEIFGVDEKSLRRAQYLDIYRGLNCDDISVKEAAFAKIDRLVARPLPAQS